MNKKETILYDYLLANSNRWVSKEELIKAGLFALNEVSHDKCVDINITRLKINELFFKGEVEHLILLNKNYFKIAETKEDALKYLKKDFDKGIKILKRYYNSLSAIKRDGEVKILDSKAKPISESLEKEIYELFLKEK